MSSCPATDSAPERRLRPGTVAFIAGLGVMLTVGVISIVLTTHRTDPAQGTPAGLPVAGVTSSPAPLVTHSVRYELSGDNALDITYVIDGSGIAQVGSADAPWSVSLHWQAPAQSSQYYSLSAEDGGRGTLKCRVVVDGTLLAERIVSAPSGMVNCSKTVG